MLPYFNQIAGGKPSDTAGPSDAAESSSSVQEDWALLLVNQQNPIPAGFEVGLIAFYDISVDYRMESALINMLKAAEKEGVLLEPVSGYRTVNEQKELYDKQLSQYLAQGQTQAEAERLVSCQIEQPGCSDHHTGLAVDFAQEGDAHFASTKAGLWLEEHAAEYGFTLRYPLRKEELTGLNCQPYHYRYVGRQAAQEMQEQDWCLEEYKTNAKDLQ